MKPAVFLDRDGTVIEQVHHLRDPQAVQLIAGAGAAIRKLRESGYAVVVVTNQSVIGRGMLTDDGLAEIHAELFNQLAAHSTKIDGIYACPIAPTVTDPEAIEHPDRKPGPGMLQQAAKELDLDLPQSWMVGDAISDTLAGKNAGCRATILVQTGYGRRQPAHHSINHTVADLGAAAKLILNQGLTVQISNQLTTDQEKGVLRS